MSDPSAAARFRRAFRRACRLDVAVRKPGNVSVASAGHRMQAAQFVASADAAVTPLTQPLAPVGARIDGAMAASLAAAGCNTNLGIVLLCAPLAAAAARPGALADAAALRSALGTVLAALDLEDARAAYRAIARTAPGGLGRAPEGDVHDAPTLDLRRAMTLAAGRDRIAQQYAEGYAELFALALPVVPHGFTLGDEDDEGADDDCAAVVQRVYLRWLASAPDSHIVRKHGSALAQTVLAAAQRWQAHPDPGRDSAFVAWDEQLKAASINPGTSADLTVATLVVAGLLESADLSWHGK